MEAMHVAEAEAKDKAHQERMTALFSHLWRLVKLTYYAEAAQMEAMHVAEAEAKDKADQERKSIPRILVALVLD